jgi:hypothetical protein
MSRFSQGDAGKDLEVVPCGDDQNLPLPIHGVKVSANADG